MTWCVNAIRRIKHNIVDRVVLGTSLRLGMAYITLSEYHVTFAEFVMNLNRCMIYFSGSAYHQYSNVTAGRTASMSCKLAEVKLLRNMSSACICC